MWSIISCRLEYILYMIITVLMNSSICSLLFNYNKEVVRLQKQNVCICDNECFCMAKQKHPRRKQIITLMKQNIQQKYRNINIYFEKFWQKCTKSPIFKRRIIIFLIENFEFSVKNRITSCNHPCCTYLNMH